MTLTERQAHDAIGPELTMAADQDNSGKRSCTWTPLRHSGKPAVKITFGLPDGGGLRRVYEDAERLKIPVKSLGLVQGYPVVTITPPETEKDPPICTIYVALNAHEALAVEARPGLGAPAPPDTTTTCTHTLNTTAMAVETLRAGL